MPEKFDALIIGAGQAGPSLAGRFSEKGAKVALIERKDVGGSCINFGCTPTKAWVANASAIHTVQIADQFGMHIDHFSLDMQAIKRRKDQIVNEISGRLKKWLSSLENCTFLEGHAQFEDSHTVRVADRLLQADLIFLNVGARAQIPHIKGLKEIPFFTSTTILKLEKVPEHLLIVGGGYIAIEFAQIFRRFGSKVTLFQRHPFIMPKEDEDVSRAIQEILEKEGLEIITNARELEILVGSREGRIGVQVQNLEKRQFFGTHILLATGRVPNTDDLSLEKANVKTDAKGFIQVDDTLRSNVPHIYALGDCNGKGAFTHTSYNDYQIVAENLFEKGSRKVSERVPIYALYMDPPLGRVGKTEKELQNVSEKVLVGKIPMTRVARALELSKTDGFMKIAVSEKSKQILGAAFLGVHCDEVIQTVAAIMYAKAPYTLLQKGVFIHPTVTELLGTVLSDLKPLKVLEKATV